MNNEEIYDKEIAPLLLQAAKLCEQYKIPFLAQVEYAPGDFSRTSFMPKGTSMAMQTVSWAMQAKGNFDALVFAAQRHAKEYGHISAVLTILNKEF